MVLVNVAFANRYITIDMDKEYTNGATNDEACRFI
jgi:hypothetical protein